MTAIVKRQREDSPPVAKAGYVVPGLGHLLTGHIVHGVGMMTLFATTVIAAVVGLPHLSSVVFIDSGTSYHALLATKCDGTEQ